MRVRVKPEWGRRFGVEILQIRTCSKRGSDRLTLRFSRRAEIVTNGLLKMCPRLEPQQHFEAACCSGQAILAVARVSRCTGITTAATNSGNLSVTFMNQL